MTNPYHGVPVSPPCTAGPKPDLEIELCASCVLPTLVTTTASSEIRIRPPDVTTKILQQEQRLNKASKPPQVLSQDTEEALPPLVRLCEQVTSIQPLETILGGHKPGEAQWKTPLTLTASKAGRKNGTASDGIGTQAALVRHPVRIPTPMSPDSSKMVARGSELVDRRREGRST